MEKRVRKVELLISSLLRGGVLVSLVLIVVGTLLSFAHNPEYWSSRSALQELLGPGATFPHTLPDVLTGLQTMHGAAIATLGLLLLIATPVMRVGVSIFAFIYEHDRVYTLITSVVFTLLLFSFLLGKVE